MATHWSLRDVTEGWSKWQIALCVGAPIALGVAGIWYYKRKQGKSETEDIGQNGGETKVPEPETPQNPKDKAQASKNKGNKFFKGGMYEQAIECYTEAIKICPSEYKQDISTFYQNRAAAYENLKNYKQVVSDCTMALELNERYVKALTRRAKALEALESYRDSLEDITTVCILEGFQNQNSLQLADRILKELGRFRAKQAYQNKKPSLPSQFFVRNYLAGFANDPVMKLPNVGKVGEEEEEEGAKTPTPTQQGPQEGQGDVQKEGDGGGAEGEGEVKGEGGDDNSDENGDAVMVEKPSALDRAKDALESGRYEEVVPLCTEEIEAAGTTLMSEALLLRGTFYVLSGQGQMGYSDFEQLLKRNSVPRVTANALIKKGSLLMQKDQQKEAMECFSRAEELDPQNSDIYHHRGQQQLLLEKLEEAIADFQKSIILSPRFPTSYVQKAFAEHRRAMMLQSPLQRDQAKKSFESAIKEFPKCSDAYMLYGQSLCDLGQFDEADQQFVKALELEPDNANTIVHRGLLMLQWKSDTEKAVKIINSALDIDPMCEYAYEILGTIKVQQGDMKGAVEMFERAISLSKSESEMAHLFSLLDAAQVQMKVAQKLGIPIPLGGTGAGVV
ncbi:mitochondrial import receptor subunit TOM70-like [Babylonia areolata]|uniref:mitochondrial import receptor subunit TOM70-like n=1 Tax=Babylonia areolata TaxID=304850 RepID=UPI003FD5A695